MLATSVKGKYHKGKIHVGETVQVAPEREWVCIPKDFRAGMMGCCGAVHISGNVVICVLQNVSSLITTLNGYAEFGSFVP